MKSKPELNLSRAPTLIDLHREQGVDFVRIKCLDPNCGHMVIMPMEAMIEHFGADTKFVLLRPSKNSKSREKPAKHLYCTECRAAGRYDLNYDVELARS